MALTDIRCKAAKPKEKPYKLTDGGGMYLEVMPNGSKYWRLKYRLHGKEKRIALGVYPEVSIIDAREGRIEAKKVIKAGQDPIAAKHETRRQNKIRSENDFESIAREWFDKQKVLWVDRHAQNILWSTPILESTPNRYVSA